jgi:hypothetical protein
MPCQTTGRHDVVDLGRSEPMRARIVGERRRDDMRVTVMGTGGTGGYFGGLLARAGEDVTFVARGAHLEAIRSKGLMVRSRLVGDFRVPARATIRARQARRS